MTEAQDSENKIRPVAEESLTTFEEVAEAAKARLDSYTSISGTDAFASINTFTSPEAVRNSEQIAKQNRGTYTTLARQPAIARVVVDEGGQNRTYYFCSVAPIQLPDKRRLFASYLSPVGRLAELEVGDEYTVLRQGIPVSVEIIERARFQPLLTNDGWDARDSIFEGKSYGPLTVESLRALFEAGEIDETALDELLREESAAANVREGVRRAVISRMDLREQPVLDRFQGEIFRLPLGSRLLILGAPGTGKTTALIRRLSQKTNAMFLESEEKQAIRGMSEDDHALSWLMFTPTELLRLYVKEAFNRQGIAAPDDRICTWTEFREGLARNRFGILRSRLARALS